MEKKLLISVFVLLLLGGGLSVGWMILGSVPPRLLTRYGLNPACEPTGRTLTVESVEFVEVGPGAFLMGSNKLAGESHLLGELCQRLGLPWGTHPEPSEEMPMHWVEFPDGFWIARTELSNEQYGEFDTEHERNEDSPGGRQPVVGISWDQATAYCAWLTELSGLGIQLPSESEWECACRAGSTREFCFGDNEKSLADFAWYEANSNGHAREVATRTPNSWGLHDFHGNVLEWCKDEYLPNYQHPSANGATSQKRSEETGERTPLLACRGGSYWLGSGDCRSASRAWLHRSDRIGFLGFRPGFSCASGAN